MTLQKAEDKKWGLDSCALHIIAMFFMLCDHAWATIFIKYEILTCIGRIAFPIFAFMIVEGFHYTHDLKKYMTRMLFWAIVTEIPFNYLVAGNYKYLFHQNVLWTFLIALGLMALVEKVKAKGNRILTIAFSILIAFVGYFIGNITFVDYYGVGILTVLVFYFFRGNDWKMRLCQFACMCYLHGSLLATRYYVITIFGHEFDFYQQALALLAFIPIWLYNGEQGYHAKWFKVFNYLFYPAHMVVLVILMHL